jgi:hypothetical protein
MSPRPIAAILEHGREPPVPLGDTGRDLYAATPGVSYADAENGWAWANYCAALSYLLDVIAEMARDDADGNEGWTALASPTRCPPEWLRVLAQWAGVHRWDSMTPADLRTLIGPRAPGLWRGTKAAMLDAAERFLPETSPDAYRNLIVGDRPVSYWRLGEQPGATVAVDDRGRVDGAYVGNQDASYRSMILADRPVSYWRLGEPPGATVAADERAANPGIYNGPQTPNLCPNPSFESPANLTGWHQGGVAGVPTIDATQAYSGSQSARSVSVGAGTMGFPYMNPAAAGNLAPVTPQLAYSFGVYMKADAAYGGTWALQVYWYDSTLTLIAPSGAGPGVVPSTSWQVVKLENVVAPANSAYVRIVVSRAAAAAGEAVNADAAMIFEGASLPAYSDTQAIKLGVPGGVPNDADTAVTLDGLSGYVNVPASAALQSALFSAEVWAFGGASTVAQRVMVADCWTAKGWLIQYADGSATAGVYDAAGVFRLTATVLAPKNAWHHLAATYDGTTLRLYVDGVLGTSLVATYGISAGGIGLGGRSNGGAWAYQGTIDDAAVYNYVLTDAQIAAHYKGTGPQIALGQRGAIPADPDTALAVAGSNPSTYAGFVSIPYDSAHYTAEFTYEIWAKIKPPAAGSRTLWEAAWSGYGRLVRIESSGAVMFFVFRTNSTSDYTYVVTPVGTIDGARWQHVVCTLAADLRQRIYVDGVLLATSAAPLPSIAIPTTSATWIGGHYTAAFGLLDEPVLYDYALTDEQVAAHYNQGLVPATPAEMLYFEERADGDPYKLRVFTYDYIEHDSVAVEAALQAAKPAGLILEYELRHGQTWAMLNDRCASWAEVNTVYPNWEAVLDETPIR